VQQIQAEMTERCLELLALPPSADDPDRAEPSFLLDIGCGSGLSGEIIEEEGHVWAGCDISASMLCAFAEPVASDFAGRVRRMPALASLSSLS